MTRGKFGSNRQYRILRDPKLLDLVFGRNTGFDKVSELLTCGRPLSPIRRTELERVEMGRIVWGWGIANDLA